MARILRGDVRWADLNPTRGREQGRQRPVLILSHDVFNEPTFRTEALMCDEYSSIKPCIPIAQELE